MNKQSLSLSIWKGLNNTNYFKYNYTQMTNIYNLGTDIELAIGKYYACFDEETGEQIVTDQELKVIQEEGFELQNKKGELLEWYLKDRANKMAHNEGVKSEIDRLQNIIKQNNKGIDRVEKIVDYNYGRTYDGKATVYGNFTVKYTNSKTTNITDESLIPDKFKKVEVKEITKIPKADIKKAIDSGEDVPGAEIVENRKLKII